MSQEQSAGRSDGLLAGGALVMIVCCAVGPAVIGAAAGSVIGGWFGIVCAVLLAAIGGLVIHRRPRRWSC